MPLAAKAAFDLSRGIICCTSVHININMMILQMRDFLYWKLKSFPPLTGVLSHADGSFLLTLTGVDTFYIFPPQDNSQLISLYGYLQLIFTHCKSDRAFGGASFRAGGSTGTALSGPQTIYIFLKMRHDTLVELLLGISACLHEIHISKSGVWRPTRAPVVTDRCERVA